MPEPDPRSAPARDVVFTLSRETLRDMAIRSYMRPPDRVLLTLMQSPRVRRLLVAEPFRSRVTALAKGDPVVAIPPTSRPDRYVVSARRWRREDPVSPAMLRHTYRRYDRVLRRAAEQARCERPVVVTTYPLLAGLAELEWADSVVYFARDDWATYPPLERWHPAFQEAYAEIRRRRRPVVAVSESLRRRLAPTGGSLVVHNGVDPAEWERLPPAPALTAGLPRPWCVYAGTVDDRLDVDMVARLATESTVILAGPVKDERHAAPLRALPSVVLPGHLPRPAVTGLIAAADVCLLPHRVTSLTEAMDPIKLYEYLAAGRPVLASDLTPVRGMGPRVRLLAPDDDPVAAFREVRGWPEVTEAERHRFVAANSWSARHVELLDFALGGDPERRRRPAARPAQPPEGHARATSARAGEAT